MKTFLISLSLGVALLYLSNRLLEPGQHQVVSTDSNANPLDKIVGDKVLDDGSIRKNNFDSLRFLPASCLNDSSKLYDVKQLSEGLYFLKRKRYFHGNRVYSLFVETSGRKIKLFHSIDDFAVVDALHEKGKTYYIAEQYFRASSFAENNKMMLVDVVCMDEHFKKIWNTSTIGQQGYLYYGEGLQLKSDTLTADLGVQRNGASSLCVDPFDLKMNPASGNATGFKYYPGRNSCGSEVVMTGEIDLSKLFQTRLR